MCERKHLIKTLG